MTDAKRIDIDVAIIGGGTAGCAAALHLANRGLSVALFERRAAGSQASGVNYGGVRQHGRDIRELPLSRRSRQIWADLKGLIGSDCEFSPGGHLKLARNAEEMAVLEKFARDSAPFDLGIELIGRNALRERFPWLGDAAFGASLCPGDGQANPRLLAPTFARAARAAGADIREHDAVTGATRGGTGFHIETESGLRARAGVLLNAAGAWADRVAGWFGEPAAIDSQSPNMLVTEPLPYRLTHNIGAVGGGLYVRQIPRGNLIFGGGRSASDRDAPRVRPASAGGRNAMANLIEFLPWAGSAQVIRTWTGIDGYMPDGIPVMGPSATTPGLFHAFGFSGHGFQLGPAVGEALGEMALEGRAAISLDSFSIRRFKSTGGTN